MASPQRTSSGQDVLGSLPVWCQVAFAVRCARRAFPLFLRRKPDTSTDKLIALERLITAVERAAEAGRADLNEMARAADEAGKIAREVSDSSRAAAVATTVSLAADAARVTAFAPKAAPGSGPPLEYTAFVRQTAVAANKAGVDFAAMQEDLEHLLVGAREFGLGYLDPPPPTLFIDPRFDEESPVGRGPAGIAVRFDADAANPADAGLVFEYLAATYRAAGGPGLRVNVTADWPTPEPPAPVESAGTPAEAAEPPPPLTPWPTGGVTLALADLHGANAALLAVVAPMLDRVNDSLPDGSPTGERAWKLIGCRLPTALPVPPDLRDAVEQFARYERMRGQLLQAVRGPLPRGSAPGEETVVNVSAMADTTPDIPTGPKVLPERLARLAEAAERHRRRTAEKLAARRVEVAAVYDSDGVLRVLVARRPPSSKVQAAPPPPSPPPSRTGRPGWLA